MLSTKIHSKGWLEDCDIHSLVSIDYSLVLEREYLLTLQGVQIKERNKNNSMASCKVPTKRFKSNKGFARKSFSRSDTVESGESLPATDTIKPYTLVNILCWRCISAIPISLTPSK